jgi:hypothetical protein
MLFYRSGAGTQRGFKKKKQDLPQFFVFSYLLGPKPGPEAVAAPIFQTEPEPLYNYSARSIPVGIENLNLHFLTKKILFLCKIPATWM